jgi:predicted nucleic acid-binding protein
MSAFVLDTSVAVAWYLPEDFAATARLWQQQLLAGQVELVVPGLHYWEFANVLRTYVRRGELDESLAHEVYAAHVEAPLTRAEPDHRGILACALEYEATAYDAVYVRLALDRDVPLLTAERTTTTWVRKLGDRVVPVRAET